MAIFNIDLASHRLHSFLQRGKFTGFAVAGAAGAGIGAIYLGFTLYQVFIGPNHERDASLSRLTQIQATVVNLKTEKASQAAALERLANVPKVVQAAALNTGGFTEDDVNYWRKQMDAFTKMTGVQLNIVGRGASRYVNATKITVSVSLSSSTSGLSSSDLAKALDFLQLYGYVESFNGTEAVVHISEKQTS